jgi:hypothetical protein
VQELSLFPTGDCDDMPELYGQAAPVNNGQRLLPATYMDL